MTTLKFFWNGIKASDGKLQKAWYSKGPYVNLPADVITIYARHDQHNFSPEVARSFRIENDTDIQADYFENDRIRVYPDHPLYPQVLKAFEAHRAHFEKKEAA